MTGAAVPGDGPTVDVRAIVPDPTRVVLRRIGAFFVDGVLVVLIVSFVVWLSGAVETDRGPCPVPIPAGESCVSYRDAYFQAPNRAFLLFAVLLLATFILVFGLLPGITGASPGKSAFGIRVVRRDGSDAGWRRGLLRSVSWIVDALVLLIPVALWGALLTPGHRRVGDFVAGTYVVRSRALAGSAPGPPRVPDTNSERRWNRS
jgi:uncharacterized RDD family membrane protein YckC